MRINDAYTRGVNAPQAPQKASKARPQGAAEAPEETDDGVRVQLSPQSLELSLQAGGDIDSARVARLRAAIESGSFQIDAAAIADKILRGG